MATLQSARKDIQRLPMINAIDLIKKHEGFSGVPYKDTEGYDTIGYGTKLPITRAEAELLLRSRLDETPPEMLHALVYNYSTIDGTRRAVLRDMLYNLGYSGLLQFRKMRAAIERLDFDAAADEMLNSKWAGQVKGRATELAAMMRAGDDYRP